MRPVCQKSASGLSPVSDRVPGARKHPVYMVESKPYKQLEVVLNHTALLVLADGTVFSGADRRRGRPWRGGFQHALRRRPLGTSQIPPSPLRFVTLTYPYRQHRHQQRKTASPASGPCRGPRHQRDPLDFSASNSAIQQSLSDYPQVPQHRWQHRHRHLQRPIPGQASAGWSWLASSSDGSPCF